MRASTTLELVVLYYSPLCISKVTIVVYTLYVKY